MSKSPNFIDLTLEDGNGMLRGGKILVDAEKEGYAYEVEIHEIVRIEVYDGKVKVRVNGTRKWDLIKKPPIFICSGIGDGDMFEEE